MKPKAKLYCSEVEPAGSPPAEGGRGPPPVPRFARSRTDDVGPGGVRVPNPGWRSPGGGTRVPGGIGVSGTLNGAGFAPGVGPRIAIVGAGLESVIPAAACELDAG